MKKLADLIRKLTQGVNFLAPALDLAIRLYLANVFFKSGLVKIQSWSVTQTLFEYEYAVPVLSPTVAAYLATATELAVPVFLALGLGGRAAALVLFVFNYVAVISYPDISPAGVKDHLLWGWLLAVLFFHGSGKLSLDHWIGHWWKSRASPVGVR